MDRDPLSNPFVPPISRLSIFHLTFLSCRISFHYPEPELAPLLISHGRDVARGLSEALNASRV